jgi:hypothetical protein
MIKNVFRAVANSSGNLLRKWPALLLTLAVYGCLLGAVWLFFYTRVATLAQVLVTLVAPIVAVVLFFVIQTMAARFAVETHAGRLLTGSMKDFWRLLLIGIPIFVLAGLIIFGAGLAAESFKPAAQQSPQQVTQQTPQTIPARARGAARPDQPSQPWQVTVVRALEYLLLLLILPLAAIHLWVPAAREGLRAALRSAGQTLARAFSPGSVLVYAIGFVGFAVIPYFLIVSRTPAGNAWVEAGLLGARLLLAAVLSLIGWVLTVGALAELKSGSVVAEPGRGAEHAPAAT